MRNQYEQRSNLSFRAADEQTLASKAAAALCNAQRADFNPTLMAELCGNSRHFERAPQSEFVKAVFLQSIAGAAPPSPVEPIRRGAGITHVSDAAPIFAP